MLLTEALVSFSLPDAGTVAAAPPDPDGPATLQPVSRRRDDDDAAAAKLSLLLQQLLPFPLEVAGRGRGSFYHPPEAGPVAAAPADPDGPSTLRSTCGWWGAADATEDAGAAEAAAAPLESRPAAEPSKVYPCLRRGSLGIEGKAANTDNEGGGGGHTKNCTELAGQRAFATRAFPNNQGIL